MGYSTENSVTNNNGFSYSNWVIPIRAPLKPINTTTGSTAAEDERETTSSLSVPTTPTTEASKIPSKLPCPPPPRKRKPSPTAAARNGNMRCSNSNNNKMCNNGRREFFITPPDLEAVFVRRHNVGC
ncbi:hypothetical protein BVRB_6g148130 [Beta vulgaris subsp. vulgaris]|nr:hypothetical protein BVRB_6g148130 [Beta vulgaris subsp. vulgaris]